MVKASLVGNIGLGGGNTFDHIRRHIDTEMTFVTVPELRFPLATKASLAIGCVFFDIAVIKFLLIFPSYKIFIPSLVGHVIDG